MKCTRTFKKLIKWGITWKIRKGEQSFLCITPRRNQIHTPIKLHEDILTVAELWGVQKCLEKTNNQRSMTLKLRKAEQSFLCATRRFDLMHIPIKLHEELQEYLEEK